MRGSGRTTRMLLDAAKAVLEPDTFLIVIVALRNEHARRMVGCVEAVLDALAITPYPRQRMVGVGPDQAVNVLLGQSQKHTRVFVDHSVCEQHPEKASAIRVWSALREQDAR